MSAGKAKRFYVPTAVRERVFQIARASGMKPGDVLEGVMAFFDNRHSATGANVDTDFSAVLTSAIANKRRRGERRRGG